MASVAPSSRKERDDMMKREEKEGDGGLGRLVSTKYMSCGRAVGLDQVQEEVGARLASTKSRSERARGEDQLRPN